MFSSRKINLSIGLIKFKAEEVFNIKFLTCKDFFRQERAMWPGRYRISSALVSQSPLTK